MHNFSSRISGRPIRDFSSRRVARKEFSVVDGKHSHAIYSASPFVHLDILCRSLGTCFPPCHHAYSLFLSLCLSPLLVLLTFLQNFLFFALYLLQTGRPLQTRRILEPSKVSPLQYPPPPPPPGASCAHREPPGNTRFGPAPSSTAVSSLGYLDLRATR